MESLRTTALAAALAVLGAGCADGAGGVAPPTAPPSLARSASEEALGPFTAWSAPVRIESPVSTDLDEVTPVVSADELSLYFARDLDPDPSVNAFHIFVSKRSRADGAWEPGDRLGGLDEIGAREVSPALSPDEHRMFFHSRRSVGCGGDDLFVSRRKDRRSDADWGAAANLGCQVNSPQNDFDPMYFEDQDGTVTLYFVSDRPPGSVNRADIYESKQRADGTFGPAERNAQLSTPANERRPYVRKDGLEIVFMSNRQPGGYGRGDLWVSTRATTRAAWSAPTNLGAVINDTEFQGGPSLSRDGTTLYFYRGLGQRPGLISEDDLYRSTRQRVR